MLQTHLLQKKMGLSTCDQHGEQEMFFCEEDQRPLCESCLSAPEHKNHQVLPLETAADKCKKKLREIWSILQKKEQKFQIALDILRRRKAQFTERTYTLKETAFSEYGKIHQFLWDENYEYQKRLVKASRRNLLQVEETEIKLFQQIQKLQQVKFEVEENLDMMPLEMIQAVPDTLKKKEELGLQRSALPSISLPTCSITGMREMLMSFHRDITLDPESAHPHLILSEDLKRVQYGSICQDLPDNKERFDCVLGVLGAQKFTSGKHYWEVEVGDKTAWELGICKDSVRRKEKHAFSSEDAMTVTAFTSGNSFFFCTSDKNFLLRRPLHKVGIFFDYDKQQIAFYDLTYRCLIYSNSNMDLEGPLCPYFSPCLPNEKNTPGSLIICPKSPQ
ncbi:probable E3 ubiquitin-protein ligase TRIML1 [Antechinus flavipes]|uniref:probable E3 ubiquitin-protein ligase TRIML1 n=1 Tax=Antechinus flavipes TaxID=38775 RepID=UPI0022363F32|nr:probable E3 ubiquitin-protein ligase TRIML1 [Antechinus flavipes]